MLTNRLKSFKRKVFIILHYTIIRLKYISRVVCSILIIIFVIDSILVGVG